MEEEKTTAAEAAPETVPAAPETVPEPTEAAADAAPEAPAPDIEALLAEAERRGYERGCNEGLRRRLASPDLWEVARRADEDDAHAADTPVTILNEMRPCVWD